ncbi:NAD(P)/FAD-dependent oxidoreductase [Cryobacterium sp. CG_9.6]|uniref:flavin-containing monooxygenase n=1 Tax=Cryobacterium sp. CG_9.6 TaxID=2760710 RepID=UPI002473C0CC|nr:NAD(P)/FAD-dependent oxidoreductase [Cryobacterium sp. CG_9.6]MDH6235267.1 cation diffusion facilitator CzcD-associated flavoprotein CzcO [Cryobacterium sp. CG_9.6]
MAHPGDQDDVPHDMLHGADVDVVILGAGFGGVGLGIQLARRGFDNFLVLERAADIGGTWRDNTYPGVACDIPSHLYSFSFRQKPDWTHVFPAGAEILEYLQECVRDEGLLPHLRLSTEVLEARWIEAEERWLITTTRGVCTARVLVSAAGRLSDAQMPALDGLDTFSGDVFHSSRWDHSVSLAGARVGIVGTGASAIQIVPSVAKVAAEMVVFQRSAAWVVPRPDRSYSPAERYVFRSDPDVLDESRSAIFSQAEEAFEERLGIPEKINALRARALLNLAEGIADPELRARLTPEYEIGCKRVLLSNEYYPALSSSHVTVESSALSAVAGSTASAASGNAYDLDVIVFATGFHTTRPPFADRIVGRSGVTLSTHWSNGMTSFASTVVHGYPNLFIIDGPNASLGHNSAIYMIETQIDYILGALDFRAANGDAVLEVTHAAEQGYTQLIDAMSQPTVWLRGACTSWYVDDRSQRLTLLWPGTARAFRERNGTFQPAAFHIAANAH